MEAFSFNTAISRIMELVNAMYKADGKVSAELMKEACDKLILLLAPITPHISEELYSLTGGTEKSIFLVPYPVCDESKLVKDEIELAVQINSKVKAKILVPSSADNASIEKIALSDEKVIEALNGATPKKVIVIKGRLVNIVV
jgi:leucyl-tRNA synthetase